MALKGNISTDHRTFSGNIPGTLVFHYVSPDETVEIRVLQTDAGVLITTKDKNGTTSAMISNGEDGFSPTAKVERTETGVLISITDKNGTTTEEVKDGHSGEGGTGDLTGYATEQWVQDGYQPKGNYALKSEIPSVPVQSVNGKTGAVQLGATDVSADPAGTAAAAVSQHNTAEDAHSDIRLELQAINNRMTAFFDSDDQTLDELSEIVAYITSNKTLIEAVTTSKVSVTDIVNNLTTSVANKPLSAAQGVVLKGLIDGVDAKFSSYALASAIPTKVSQLENDKEYLETSELTEAVNTALSIAKESGEFDGANGERGKGVLRVTTSATSASGTGPTGIAIKYKIALAAVKSEAGVDEVLVGDTVLRSYYTYPVAKVDASYVYLGAYTSIRGATGPAGADGKNPVKGTDYWTESDQEAIVQQVITALGTPVFGRVEEGNKITFSTEHLADGTYYLGYEDKGGNWVEICTVEIGGMGDAGSIELVWADGVKLDKNTGVENTVNGEYAASQHIELVDGYTYTFSQTGYGGVNICYYDANGTGLGYELLWDGVDGVKTQSLTPIAGAATFRVRLYYGLNTTIEEAKDRYSLTYEKTA